MKPQPIRFYFQGRTVEVVDAHPTRTVLEWLREEAGCSGTKEGCNEGDCGACTVAVGRLGENGSLALSTVNACTRFLPTLHGKALFTVEDLKALAPEPGLHPVQQALVNCHGSQCGFCTPGFVMSLWGVYEEHQARGTRPGRVQLAHALAGNLCRCTGYRPILEAGEQMFDLPVCRLDRTAVAAALKPLQHEETFVYGPPAPAPGATRTSHFFAPTKLKDLAALRCLFPTARLLAGATDVALWVNKQFRELGDLIYLGEVKELQHVEHRSDSLRIGAAVSLEKGWRALVERCPSLEEVWLRFASPPVRHAGTLVGNLANGSPIGDAAPVLMALDAELELRQGPRLRRLPLHEFYLDYMVNRLEAGEFIEALVVPLPLPQPWQVRAYKVSKRFDSDISALCAGLAVRLDEDAVVADVRIAFGGMAGVVRRAKHAEDALRGQAWTQDGVHLAQQALASEFQPLSDLRASSRHRMQVAQNLLQRFWLETRPVNPLPAAACRVWQGVLGQEG